MFNAKILAPRILLVYPASDPGAAGAVPEPIMPQQPLPLSESQPFPYRGEVWRKLLHLLALALPAAAVLWGQRATLAGLIPLTALALLFDWLRVRSHGVRHIILVMFGAAMRPRECPEVGQAMVVNGATWVLVSLTLLLLFFDLSVAVIAFVVFMVGDAAAALIGRRWGFRTIGRTTSTVEGSLAFLGLGLAAGVAVAQPWNPEALLHLPWLVLGVGTVVAATLEILELPLNDNVLAPFGAALAMTLLL